MIAMITRREFTKCLSSAAALMTLSPVSGWAVDEPKISADAAKIYRDSFILDGNALAGIGWLLRESNQDQITRVIRSLSRRITPSPHFSRKMGRRKQPSNIGGQRNGFNRRMGKRPTGWAAPTSG